MSRIARWGWLTSHDLVRIFGLSLALRETFHLHASQNCAWMFASYILRPDASYSLKNLWRISTTFYYYAQKRTCLVVSEYFLTEPRLSFWIFGRVDVWYSVNTITYANLRDGPSHRSKLYWCLLDKIILFHFDLFWKKAYFMLDAKGSLNHRVVEPFLTWSLSQIRAGARRLVALLSLEFGAPNIHYIAFNTKN